MKPEFSKEYIAKLLVFALSLGTLYYFGICLYNLALIPARDWFLFVVAFGTSYFAVDFLRYKI